MTPLFFLIFVILLLKNPEDRRNSDLIKYLIGGSIVLSIIGAIIESVSIPSIAILGIIAYLISLLVKKNKYNEKARKYGFEERDFRGRPIDATFRDAPPKPYQPYQTGAPQQNGEWKDYKTPTYTSPRRQQTPPVGHSSQGAPNRHPGQEGPNGHSGHGAPVGHPGQRRQNRQQRPNFMGDSVYGGTTLPTSASKRRKIIEKFNEKYQLCLTDAQIQSMVNSSYVSQTWRREIEAMNRKYENMYEWFQGPTSWLRVYMYVFKVQEICSDIELQENIVAHSFEDIFNYADECETFSIHDTIDRVNTHFMTTFDDATFAMAYRFLEKKGKKHVIKTHKVVENESSVEDLESKYTKMQQ